MKIGLETARGCLTYGQILSSASSEFEAMRSQVINVFISGVSREFKSYREKLARELRRKGFKVKVEEDFTARSQPLLIAIHTYIQTCNAAICLIGDCYGTEPTRAEAVNFGGHIYSYTQWEFLFASARRNCDTYVLVPSPSAPRDTDINLESAESLSRQKRFFQEEVVPTGKVRIEFQDAEHLVNEVLVIPDLNPLHNTDVPSVTVEERKRQDNRHALLRNVKSRWLDDVLERSAPKRIALRALSDPRDIPHPWDLTRQIADPEPRSIPPDTRLVDILVDKDSFLILGEPGCGKTTSLLQLASETLVLAERSWDQPVPVILLLTSWAERRASIEDWVVEELFKRYYIHPKYGRSWIQDNALLLLLDGLDEVDPRYQDDCVRALNKFHKSHVATPMVVCARVADYRAMRQQLSLNASIILQKLTDEQVDQYLESTGATLTALKTSLSDDPVLKELARSPLMLNIMSVAYKNLTAQDMPRITASVSERRTNVFAAYLARMLGPDGTEVPYPHEHTKMWLCWLAEQMTRCNQSIFQIDQLQPSWLGGGCWVWCYVMVTRTLAGAIVGLSAGLNVGMFSRMYIIENQDRPIGMEARIDGDFYASLVEHGLKGIGVGFFVGFFIALIDGLRFQLFVPRLAFRDTWSQMLAWTLSIALAVGVGVYCAMEGSAALIYGLGFGLLFGGRMAKQHVLRDVQTVEVLRLSLWGSICFGVCGALLGGVIAAFVCYQLHTSWPPMVKSYAINGATVLGTWGVLTGGLRIGVRTTKASPLEGIQLSFQNAAMAGCLAAFPLLTLLTITWGIAYGPELHVGLKAGLVTGGTMGWVTFCWFGGFDLFSHYCLRAMLSAGRRLPFDCTKFLDYATQRKLIYRRGGGYVFAHRLLMEHLAGLRRK
jgi:hypothetical protein